MAVKTVEAVHEFGDQLKPCRNGWTFVIDFEAWLGF